MASSSSLLLKPRPESTPETKHILSSKCSLYEFSQSFLSPLEEYFKKNGWEAPTNNRVANFVLSWTPIGLFGKAYEPLYKLSTNQNNAKKAYDVARAAIELALKNESFPGVIPLIILTALEKMLKVRRTCPNGSRIASIIDQAFKKFLSVASALMPISTEDFKKRTLAHLKEEYRTETVRHATEDLLDRIIVKFSKLSPSSHLLEQSTYPVTDLVSGRIPPNLLSVEPHPEQKSELRF